MCMLHIYYRDHRMDTPVLFPPIAALNAEQEALLAALEPVLAPLAQLCIGKNITIQLIEEQLRAAFVKAAHEVHGDLPGQRRTSRISTTTGLTRRAVSRLEQQRTARPQQLRRSPVTELFTRWMSDPALQTADQQPAPLPRQGAMPSFEALAQSVTRDVHPRTLLEELCRLKLARHDEPGDTVHLLRDAFVPRGDWVRMVGFLGSNVGDHLRAATANVLGDGRQHLEQAIFADELSEESLVAAHKLMAQQWRTLLAEVAPQLETLIDSDRIAGRSQNRSLRIGLYTWSQPMPEPQPNLNPKESTP
jgi:hypothetical protein